MDLLFREHPKAQPEGGFRRSSGANLRLIFEGRPTLPNSEKVEGRKGDVTMTS